MNTAFVYRSISFHLKFVAIFRLLSRKDDSPIFRDRGEHDKYGAMFDFFMEALSSTGVDQPVRFCYLSLKIEKNLTIALYQSQREIHTARAAPGDLSLKFHPKDYQQKLTY